MADIYDEAIATWGQGPQLRQLQEECGELVAAVNHFERGRVTAHDLALEMADVSIMLEQGIRIVGREVFEGARERKLARVRSRIDQERIKRLDEAQLAVGVGEGTVPNELVDGEWVTPGECEPDAVVTYAERRPTMADLPDYLRGFLAGVELARRLLREFGKEHPLLHAVTDEIRSRIASAELEETLRLHHAGADEARKGERG